MGARGTARWWAAVVMLTGAACARGPAAGAGAPALTASGSPRAAPPDPAGTMAALSMACGAGTVPAQSNYPAVVGWLERLKDGYYETGQLSCLKVYYTDPGPDGYAAAIAARADHTTPRAMSPADAQRIEAGARVDLIDVPHGQFDAHFYPATEVIVWITYRWDGEARHWRVATERAAGQ